jgi:hypothetical protein
VGLSLLLAESIGKDADRYSFFPFLLFASWGFLLCMAWAQFTMASRTALRLHITALLLTDLACLRLTKSRH